MSRLAQSVFTLPAQIATLRRRRLAVALDEFQAIQAFDEGSHEIEHALRASIQHQRQVGYVFSGRHYPWLERPRPNVWYGVTVETPDYTWRLEELRATPAARRFISYEPAIADVRWNLEGIDWLIAGGLSSPKAPAGADPAIIRSARDQAIAAGVAFYFKQWGGRTPTANGNTLDGRQWLEVPTYTTEARA